MEGPLLLFDATCFYKSNPENALLVMNVVNNTNLLSLKETHHKRGVI